MTLPPPVCTYGYSEDQVKDILGDRYGAFVEWHTGQTGAICEGGDCDAAHGLIVYAHDLKRFLSGRRELASEWD